MRYVITKSGALLAAVWFTATLTFFALQVLPGDPAVLILGTEGDPAMLESLREQLGLSLPLGQRYWLWLVSVLQLDFGVSIRYSRPVSQLMASALPVTLFLAALAVTTALALAVPLGVYTSVGRANPMRAAIGLLTHLGMAMPSFWLGMLLIQWIAVERGWFPAGGFFRPSAAGWGMALRSLLLPALTLAIPRAAILTRMVRASMKQVLAEDYIRTARSKGVSRTRTYFLHALRNAGLNISTVAAIQMTQLLVGTIIVEQVFSLPGMGRLLLAAVLQRDLPLVQGLVVVGAAMIVSFHYVFDLLLGWLDPRIRFE